MTVTIQLSDHDLDKNIYHAGDEVSGTVYLKGPVSDNNLIVIVELLGLTETCADFAKTTFCDKRKLFSHKAVLHEEPFELQKGAVMAWPFNLLFPNTTTEYPGLYAKNKLWEEASHDLPPTMQVSGNLWDGRISYCVRATVTRSSFLKPTLHAEEPLFFRMKHDPAGPGPTLARKRKTLMLPENFNAGATHKFGSLCRWARWIKGMISVDKPSKMEIQVFMPGNMELHVIEPLGVKFYSNLSNTRMSPSIRLLRVDHKITCLTKIRVTPGAAKDTMPKTPTFFGDLTRSRKRSRKFTSGKIERVIEAGETVDLGGNDIKIWLNENYDTCTFRSYAISREHRSKTLVYFEVGGLKRKMTFRNGALNVLPRYKPPGENIPEIIVTTAK